MDNDQNNQSPMNNMAGGSEEGHKFRNVTIAVVAIVVLVLIALAYLGGSESSLNDQTGGDGSPITDEQRAALLKELATEESDAQPVTDEQRAALLKELAQ